MRLFPRTVTTLAAGLALGLAVPPAHASAPAAGPDTVTLTGTGWGHGRGLSQYGAQARANAGQPAAAILDFYYPGTATGVGGGSVKVLITADTSSNVVVQHRSRLKVRSLATGKAWKLRKRGAKRWKLTAHGADTKLSVKTKRWHKVRIIPGQAEFQGKGGTLRLYVPGGAADYRGKIRSVVPANGQGRDTVNVVSVEKYLRGVVPAEMPAKWNPQAVQAQAVAARTYAIFERDTEDHGPFDVYDTTQSQVYRGIAVEQPESNAAIAATAGQIRTYGGLPAYTQFSSSNGGWTAGGGEPYLAAAPDPYDPKTSWTAVVPASSIETAFPKVGDFQSLQLTLDTPSGGHVASVRIVGPGGVFVDVDGEVFRSRLGLRSTMFAQTA
ncbi:SpoIID/LytB domain-containing protein [Nocardioides sp. SLBN-35]|uniref:SpoIID/LytB domain-containing protein n=1 Tax=Nocardioides sp. SLBN-35 TaxID=2768445 RepID=UPI0011525FE1|nr:SpoIID/LytB domain-containing protein [Nocardioides sp. SLBN-35]TQK72380.1 SpoIID/LytB domain protein [Nocardioides sp. SLBN-35]